MIQVIIIFILLVGVIYWLQHNPQFWAKISSLRSQSDAISPNNTPKDGIPKTPRGGLYQGEPCQLDLINDSGVCKKPPGADCLTSSECSQGYFCFNQTCTMKPATWDECFQTTCNEGLVCIDRHLMKLVDNKFIMLPGWWSMKGCIDICSELDLVFVLKEDGVFQVRPTQPRALAEAIIDDHQLERIFIFRGALYGLANNGHIYRGISMRELRSRTESWSWERIEFISGRDISNDHIVDVSTCCDGTITLTLTDNRKLTYADHRWTEVIMMVSSSSSSTSSSDIDDHLNRLWYGVNYHHFLVLSNSKAALYVPGNSTPLYIVDRVRDAVIDPLTPTSIIIITTAGMIKRIRYVNTALIEEVLDSSMDPAPQKLRVTNDSVWLLTNHRCLRV